MVPTVVRHERLESIRLQSFINAFKELDNAKGTKSDKLFRAFVKTYDQGLWQTGDRIPTERELTKLLPVSGGTIQTFMRRLSESNLVNRRRGVGSYIAEQENIGDNAWYLRFSSDHGKTFQRVEVLSISIEETERWGAWSDFLGEQLSYIHLVREMRIGGLLTVIGEFWLDSRRFKPLLDFSTKALSRRHFRTLLNERFNAPTISVNKSIALEKFEDDLCAKFGMETKTIGMVLRILGYAAGSAPLYYQRFIIPRNDFQLYFD